MTMTAHIWLSLAALQKFVYDISSNNNKISPHIGCGALQELIKVLLLHGSLSGLLGQGWVVVVL